MPDSPEAHYNYAAFLTSTGKENDALSELRRVVQIKTDHTGAQLQLANVLFAKGDLEEAKVHYTAALRADPKLAAAHNSLGRLYLSEGQISQAIVQFGEALRLNPNDKEAEENLRIAKASDAQFLRETHN
jgi:tetratricopeptide (TPR) repeat protein